MNKFLRQSQLFLKRNGSTILTCVGGVGVVVTTVTAVKATPKALLAIEHAKEEKGEELTKLEVVKAAGPAYIPTIISGAATLSCIFGANIMNKRQQAALVSAYAFLDNTHKEYKKKVKEMYGEDGASKVTEEIAKDKYNEADISEEDEKQLFFDEFSGRYFNSTIEDVQRAEYQLNRDLIMRGYAYLDEFYEHLNIPAFDPEYTLGWSEGSNYYYYWQNWIDFTHKKVVMDDGLECYIVSMLSEPVMDFMEYS